MGSACSQATDPGRPASGSPNSQVLKVSLECSCLNMKQDLPMLLWKEKRVTLPDKTYPRGVNPSDKAQSGGWNPSDKAQFGESENIPAHLRAMVDSLGSRATMESVEAAIVAFCHWRTLSAQQIARLLKRRVTYIQNRYLKSLVAAGRLEYLYPDNPAHPRQAYRAASKADLEN